MGRRSARPADERRLEVLLGSDDAVPTALEPADETPTSAGEPEEYGVRVSWQSEAERIEAAEFLVATRAQQESRIRAEHDREALRAARRRLEGTGR